MRVSGLDLRQRQHLIDGHDRQRVSDAIAEAERRTSGELCVVVCRYGWNRIEATAARLFRKHGLHRTRHRNAVMFLVVEANRELFVYGDEGVAARVPADFWSGVRDVVLERFRQGDHADGLIAGVEAVAGALAEHFPPEGDTENELSNEMVVDAP